jgi:hypothetical protein
MKKLILSLMSGLLLSATFFSCNDDNYIGSSMQPDTDVLSVYYDTVGVKSETVLKSGLYLRNSTAVLGEYTDPTFGTVKSDFLAQLYCPYNFTFPDDVSQIDSAYVDLYYSSWFGDSTESHHLQVWELDKKTPDSDTKYLSTTDPSEFTSKTRLLASGGFSAADFASGDSIKSLYGFQRVVRIPFDLATANRILAENKSHPEKFKDAQSFADYFKGIYVTTDVGNGSLLYLTHAEVEMRYLTHLWSNSSGKKSRDSLVVAGAYFPVTKDVRQINRVDHPDLSRYLTFSPSDTIDYIYAPAGMVTKVTIPDSLFRKGTGKLSGTTINSLKLKISATQLSDADYKLSPPEKLLLIDARKYDDFFSGFNVNDGMYSFVADYDSYNEDYVFGLSYYAQKMIRSYADSTSTEFSPYREFLLVPVKVVQNSSEVDVRLEHVVTPSAVKIRSGSHPDTPMQLRVLYSKKRNDN